MKSLILIAVKVLFKCIIYAKTPKNLKLNSRQEPLTFKSLILIAANISSFTVGLIYLKFENDITKSRRSK